MSRIGVRSHSRRPSSRKRRARSAGLSGIQGLRVRLEMRFLWPAAPHDCCTGFRIGVRNECARGSVGESRCGPAVSPGKGLAGRWYTQSMDQNISYPGRLQAACKLAGRLEQAVEALETSFPLEPNAFDPDRLDLEVSLALDAFRVRFSDLQDILGRSLFPAIARADEDESPAHVLTTRERIALMEKREIIDADTNTIRSIASFSLSLGACGKASARSL